MHHGTQQTIIFKYKLIHYKKDINWASLDKKWFSSKLLVRKSMIWIHLIAISFSLFPWNNRWTDVSLSESIDWTWHKYASYAKQIRINLSFIMKGVITASLLLAWVTWNGKPYCSIQKNLSNQSVKSNFRFFYPIFCCFNFSMFCSFCYCKQKKKQFVWCQSNCNFSAILFASRRHPSSN